MSVTAGSLVLGENAKMYVSGGGTKSFGGSSGIPGIHLGAGSELVIQTGGTGYEESSGWLTTGANYATGEGNIVLEGVTAVNDRDKGGILWAFMDAGETSADESQIGALKLRSAKNGSGTMLTMRGEMGGENNHALGKIKEIYVEAGSSLLDSSGALGKKSHLYLCR